MMRIPLFRFAPSLIPLTLVGLALAGAPEGSGEKRLLLISNPPVWPGPGVEPTDATLFWKAGLALEVNGVESVADQAGAASETWYRVAHETREAWLPGAYLSLPPVRLDEQSLERIGAETVDRRRGLPPNYAPEDLVPVGPGYDDDVNYRLRSEAAEALESLMRAARFDGVQLYVVSAYRPWSKQQRLYERRVRRSGRAQRTVAKPGHSEHQLGAAVDFTDGNAETLLKESFGETAAGRWLRENAWSFGFAVSYTRHNMDQTGYAPEPWHYRYWGLDRARSKHFAALGK